MKKFVLYLLVLLLPLSAHAESSAKPTVKGLLQKKLMEIQSFSASFEQKVYDAQKVELQTANGKLFIQHPQKLYWESLPPNELTLIADGLTVWHVDPFVEQVIAIDQAEAASNHPIMLLAQPESTAWQNYSVVQDGSNYLMNALQEDAEYSQIKLSFDSGRLTGITIIDRIEQVNQLLFTGIVQNKPLDQSIFRFSVPDGYELDDQRSQ